MTETTALLPDDALRGRPKMIPCSRCGGSRVTQERVSYYTEDEKPLCRECWEVQYNDGESDAQQS